MRMFFAAASIGLATLLTAAVLASPVGAQGQGAGPKFEKTLPSEGNTQYSMEVSEDKKSALIWFDGLETTWSGGGAPLFATRVFSISMPLTGAEKGAKLEVFLEGSVAHRNRTDISLITTVNGRTHVMDFAKLSVPSVEHISEGCDKSRSTQERDAIKRKFGAKYADRPRKPNIASKLSPNAQPEPELVDFSFQQCILLDAPSASALRVNVIFALHRHNPETSGYVNVTSIYANILSEAKPMK